MWWREHSAKDREDAMLGRAGDIYFQYRRSDNQAAIVLYQRALSSDPRSAKALAGLSSALTQRALRWPEGQDVTPATGSALGAALRSGQLHRPGPAADVRRALALAREAQARDSRDPTVLRSLGLALSASGRLIEAAQVYDRILEFAPDDWGVLINRADLHDLEGREDLALPLLERAYDNMDRAYRHEPARVLPWQAKLGVEIARRYQRIGNLTSAEQWYRRTLSDDPSSQTALADLAELGSRRERDQIDPNRQAVREAASPTP